MAYKMEYGMHEPIITKTKKVKRQRKSNSRRWIILALVAALVVLCATTDILIPGDAAVTKAAMGDFISNIKDGEQVVDAFAAFCQTVLQGG